MRMTASIVDILVAGVTADVSGSAGAGWRAAMVSSLRYRISRILTCCCPLFAFTATYTLYGSVSTCPEALGGNQ